MITNYTTQTPNYAHMSETGFEPMTTRALKKVGSKMFPQLLT